MKALETRLIRDGSKYYRLRKGEPVPEMPAKLLKQLQGAGLVEKPAEAKVEQAKPAVEEVSGKERKEELQ